MVPTRPSVHGEGPKALKGICKDKADKTQDKGRRKDMEPGKKAMSFELFEKTNCWLIERGDRSAVFARAYLGKTWSLACRSDSTQSIKVADLIWRDDASGIVFAHQKTIRMGLGLGSPDTRTSIPSSGGCARSWLCLSILCCIRPSQWMMLVVPSCFGQERRIRPLLLDSGAY